MDGDIINNNIEDVMTFGILQVLSLLLLFIACDAEAELYKKVSNSGQALFKSLRIPNLAGNSDWTTEGGTISPWLPSPLVAFRSDSTISFYTHT